MISDTVICPGNLLSTLQKIEEKDSPSNDADRAQDYEVATAPIVRKRIRTRLDMSNAEARQVWTLEKALFLKSQHSRHDGPSG